MNILIDKLNSEIPNWKNVISSIEREDSNGSRSLRDGQREVFLELKEFWKYNDFNPNRAKDLINELKKHEPYHAPKWDELGEFRRICVQYYTKDNDAYEAFQRNLGGGNEGFFDFPENNSNKVQVNANNDGIKSLNLGSQTWMLANLNVEHFRNGDTIPEAKTVEDWKRAGEEGKPAWCFYENNPLNGENYGKLYNWFAVNDSRGLCPEGWHIPSDTDWNTLLLLTANNDGRKLKSKNGWDSFGGILTRMNGNGTNMIGFQALPGGERLGNGKYNGLKKMGSFWSSTKLDEKNAICRILKSESNVLQQYSMLMTEGHSVRCVKNNINTEDLDKDFWDALKKDLENLSVEEAEELGLF
jgi:uncharacterized protein (TIGR02145 family)